MTLFKGSAVAIVTPFNKNGVNYDAFKALLDFQLDGGTDGIVVCGTTGEASTMTADEKLGAIEFAIKHVAGRVPVIAGTGGNNTANVIRDSIAAEKAGVDALLIVTPYYNKTSQAGLVAHYTAVADSVHTPIIVYNVPARTGLNVLPKTMAEMAKHKNIVGIKEASANIEQIVELARVCPGLDIYSGNDDHVVPMMSVGGKGVISTGANIIPRDMHDMCRKFFDGDLEGAKRLQFKVNPLVKAVFVEVNPMPIKTALNLMGMNAGMLRLPLVELQPASLEVLKHEMAAYGLL
jgi:4-hydroxy-tetrahydrodipicolinate synthase